jgi:HlyD family secretion protein
MKRILPILVVVAVLAVTGYFGWTWYSGQSSATAGSLGGSGTVETDQIAVTPQTTGRIVVAPGAEGTPVKKGDVLYRLDASLAGLQVQQAQAGVNAASANLRAVRDDSSKKTADVDQARAQLEQAQVALTMAKVQAAYAVITSPIDGVISSIAAKAGENAVPGNTLAVISNPASLTVTIFVPESEIGQVKIGQTGTLMTDSVSKSYRARVVFIATQAEFTPASIETKDQRVKLVYAVKLSVADRSGTLKPGMPADVTFE